MFDKLKWMPIQDFVQYRRSNLVYKAINNMLPDYMCNMFTHVNTVHSRNTRFSANDNLYVPPRAKLSVFRKSLRYAGPQVWNTLPAEIRKAPSVSTFKHRYFDMYFN